MHLFMLGPVLLLHASVQVSILFCYMHLFVLGPVVLYILHLHTRSYSPVTYTCSCSVLFSCYTHLSMFRPVILLQAPLHARSCYMYLFMLSPILLLHVPLNARSCSPVICTFYSPTTAVKHCPCHTIHTTCYIYID